MLGQAPVVARGTVVNLCPGRGALTIVMAGLVPAISLRKPSNLLNGVAGTSHDNRLAYPFATSLA